MSEATGVQEATREWDVRRRAAEVAWDEAVRATDEMWSKVIGWATAPNPDRADFPARPENPYRAPAHGGA